ncbi:MAG: transcription-repair coupling factor (superfamily II helicase) [Rhodothermales bacterium]|jgi:transcription-repair coupling factor (superfamily II helicase)
MSVLLPELKTALADLSIGNTATMLCEADPQCQSLALLSCLEAAPTIVVVCPSLAETEGLAEEFRTLLPLIESTAPIHLLPELESKRQHLMPENESERARVFHQAIGNPGVFFASITAALSPVPRPAEFADHQLPLTTGETGWPPQKLAEFLVELDYDNEMVVRVPGEFSWRGGIMDIYSPSHPYPIRLDYFGDELESMRFFDPETQRSVETIQECRIIPRGESVLRVDDSCQFIDYFLDRPTLLVFVNVGECEVHVKRYNVDRVAVFTDLVNRPMQRLFLQQAGLGIDEDTERKQRFPFFALSAQFDAILPEMEESIAILHRQHLNQQIARWVDDGYEILACTDLPGKFDRFLDLIDHEKPRELPIRHLPLGMPNGALWPLGKRVLLSDAEMFGRATKAIKRKRRHYHVDHAMQTGNEMIVGDIAVHAVHGICRFLGLSVEAVNNVEQEVLALEFQDEIRVYVPLEQAYLISRYSGHSKGMPRLSRIGSAHWRKATDSATHAVTDLAAELIRIQAVREARPGFAFNHDDPTLADFEAAFPYDETEDQIKAIADVYADMERTQPMDRLICGDVGYGKTEVAMRAACKAVIAGKQVCVLVPTTVLAQQHYISFRERFKQFPLLIDVLSRFRTRKQQNAVVEACHAGRVDIVIGTHRLISGDMHFRDLGLIIVDEEQRFGVKHKEKLKRLRANVDVLTMTATPIPRTLYFSMAGLRDMSTIVTPPLDRRPVQTHVARYDNTLIRDAILHEVQRGGQVFFLHNRVKTIEMVCAKLRKLLPDVSFSIGHGQMGEHELEATMLKFIEGRTDVLVSTTIIESGLDIPNANTIIIDRADRFGLAELYQLRGRVGRYHRQAYAYLLLPTTTIVHGTARERLAAIRQYTQLGSGFKLAMRDLEIRGAGNILGSQQSGHITAIGFDMYCRLMRIAVARLRKEEPPTEFDITLEIDFICAGLEPQDGKLLATLPRDYICEQALRLNAYREFSEVRTEVDLANFAKGLRDRFGRLPEPAEILFDLKRLKIAATLRGIVNINVRNRVAMLRTRGGYAKTGIKHPRLKAHDPAEQLLELMATIDAIEPI